VTFLIFATNIGQRPPPTNAQKRVRQPAESRLARLRVAAEQLHSTATGWGTMAGQLSTTAPAAPHSSFQPSAAAVTAIHTGVTAASGVLTARTQITAVKTLAAATAYTRREATSAALVDALGESL
jgi:hypothetical protein